MALDIDLLHSRRNVPIDATEIFADLILAVRFEFVTGTLQRTAALPGTQAADPPPDINFHVSKFFCQFRRQRHISLYGIGVCLSTSATISSEATFSTSARIVRTILWCSTSGAMYFTSEGRT